MIEPQSSARSLRLDSIAKSYAAAVAVHPLSLVIPAGSLVAMLGPSGCGKSTTLRIVAGLEEPDHGRVFLDEDDITDVPCSRRSLGLVFQNYALFPHMTVADNVSFGLRMSGLNRSSVSDRTTEALRLVRLTGLDDRYPGNLSGGQQQRVALARTLVMRPSVLLLDEPLGALDKNLRESMQFELRRLQRSLGVTTVLVTHDQEEALTLSDMVVVMNEGRIVQTGAPQEVYDRPQTRFVAEFLGAANIFTCFAGAEPQSAAIRLANGSSITVPVTAAPPQERFLLAVRPERIVINDNPTTGTFSLPGSVRGLVFRGNNYVYEIELPGLAAPVYAQAQHSRAGLPAGVGSAVYLSWSPDSGVVLRDQV